MRKLTVSTLWRQRSAAVVPHLRLSGRWLQAAGFTPGAKVRVQVDAGQLVITAN